MGLKIASSSFFGLFTRWLIGHIFIWQRDMASAIPSNRHPQSHPAISRDAPQPG
jgi:hypothetical protein